MKKFQCLALAAVAALVSACGSNDKAATAVDETPKVKVAKVNATDVDQLEVYTATVQSDVKNNIAPQAYLRIEKIMVEVGDRVNKGQVLVQLDATNLNQLKLQIENAKITFNRVDELYKVGGASKAEWDNARMQLDVMETQYKNLLANSQLCSPITGVVTARNYDNGDMTGQLPVLVVEQDQPVKMVINVSEKYYPIMKKGMPVTITLDAYGEEEFAGVVDIINPAINASTHTFPVEIRVANADRRVRPGMFGRVTVVYGTNNHVVVPDVAVVKQAGAGDHYVFVLKSDNTVSYNKVTLGRRLDTLYEIVSGVDADATVVVAGQNKLANGMKVEVIK
ncbi:MAG: efflux RND transporter periplasmic adaptor subunit [Bacteroidaceae bacterium]|nr:efflux RND transporter periplasmic adaptor subunit [Bacteroidaceae bacterium]